MEIYTKPFKNYIYLPPYSETAKKGVEHQGVFTFFFKALMFQPIAAFENDSNAALYPQPVKSWVPIGTEPIPGG